MVQPEDQPRYNPGVTVIEMGRTWYPTPPARGWEPRRGDLVPRQHQYPQPQPQPQPQPGWHQPPSHHYQPTPPVAPMHRVMPPAVQPLPVAPVVPAAPKPGNRLDDEKRNYPRHYDKRDNPERDVRKPGFELLR